MAAFAVRRTSFVVTTSWSAVIADQPVLRVGADVAAASTAAGASRSLSEVLWAFLGGILPSPKLLNRASKKMPFYRSDALLIELIH